MTRSEKAEAVYHALFDCEGCRDFRAYYMADNKCACQFLEEYEADMREQEDNARLEADYARGLL